MEKFKIGDVVFLRNAETETDPQSKKCLSLYAKEMGKGPFFVHKSVPSTSLAHPQTLTLGSSQTEVLKVSFGGQPAEDLEVSGYWLTKKAW